MRARAEATAAGGRPMGVRPSWPLGRRPATTVARPPQRPSAAARPADSPQPDPAATLSSPSPPSPPLLHRALAASLAALLSLQATCLVSPDASLAAAAAAASPPSAAATYEAYAAAAHEAADTSGERGDENDDDMFTPDARLGMRKLEAYWDYVRDVALPMERTLPECASGACTANRRLLEQAWQVVSNEFFDASSSNPQQQQKQQQHFSQSWWAGQLLPALTLEGPRSSGTATTTTTMATSKTTTKAKAIDGPAELPSPPLPPRGVLTNRADAEDALRWMVGSLGDRYTTYLPPAAWGAALRHPVPANARRYLEAQSVGVGLALGAEVGGGGRVVESPMAGSVAEEAGVRRGDVVLALDGVPAASLPPADVARVLRGPAGSSITVTLAARSPADNGAPRDLVLERRPIPQPAVREARLPLPPLNDNASSSSYASSSSRPLPREALYLRVNYFSHATTKALAASLAAAAADPAVAGVVLDLRNDPGGVFEEAVADAAMLIGDADAPVAATIRSPNGAVDAVWRGSALSGEIFTPAAQRAARMVGSWSPGGGFVPPLSERPVAVLLNRSSASASELLAVALRDNATAAAAARQRFQHGLRAAGFAAAADRAGDPSSSPAAPDATTAVVVPRVQLIGERSFGKGVVQHFFPLGDDSGRTAGVAVVRSPPSSSGAASSSSSSSSSFPPSSPLVASGGGLKITVAKYVGPHGTDVARDGGVAPDLRCADHPRGVGRMQDACIVQAINFVAGGGGTSGA